jgi:hypothetical protein
MGTVARRITQADKARAVARMLNKPGRIRITRGQARAILSGLPRDPSPRG